MKKRVGKTRSVWLSPGLDKLLNRVRKEIGTSRSSFIKFCIRKTLSDLSLLSSELKKGLKSEISKEEVVESAK